MAIRIQKPFMSSMEIGKTKQRSFNLKNEEIQQRPKTPKNQQQQNTGQREPGPIPIQLSFFFREIHIVQSIVLRQMRTLVRSEGFIRPGRRPALTADFLMAMGAFRVVFGIKR
jgi:hypothetical protein